MNIAISNIAWEPNEDEAVNELLNQWQIQGIEVAPPKYFAHPDKATGQEINTIHDIWQKRGKQIVATQSILYGHPELTIFDSSEVRQNTLAYLKQMIWLSAQLGAKAIVFGSPKNRQRKNVSLEQALTIAESFFYELGECAQENGVYFCIEPNSPVYEADFATNTQEAITLVKLVNHPNFCLHLDVGVMTINNENYLSCIEQSLPFLRHFHISEPYLNPVSESKVPHDTIANYLRKIDYQYWISIEMRNNGLKAIDTALALVTKYY